jgi:hypothetical protein
MNTSSKLLLSASTAAYLFSYPVLAMDPTKGEHARPQTALTRMAPTPQPSAVPEPSPASQGPAPAQVFDLLAAAGGQDFNKRLLYIAECVGGKPSAPEPLPLSAEIRVMAISPAAAATGKK